MKVTLCQEGVARRAPQLPKRLQEAGAKVDFVECFDKCEACERHILARIDGASVAARSTGELLDMVAALRAEREGAG